MTANNGTPKTEYNFPNEPVSIASPLQTLLCATTIMVLLGFIHHHGIVETTVFLGRRPIILVNVRFDF